MKTIIPGWIHQPGWHCASTVIADVMTFRGVEMTEPLCFGIGAGLGFAYLEGQDFNPSRFTAVRSRNLEVNFFQTMQLLSGWNTNPSPEDALEQTKQYIDKGVPSLIRADIYYIPYYKSNSHFPGHVICVWGYDDKKQEFYVADTERPGLKPVPYSSMKEARFGNLSGYKVQGDHIPVEFSLQKPDWEVIIKKALIKQGHDLFKPEFGNLVPMGFPGMEKAAKALADWGLAKDWKWSARWFYQVIEKRGTGGGAFRKLYAKFLQEIQNISPQLSQLAPPEQMAKIADEWTQLSSLMKQISEKDTPQGFDRAANMLHQILEQEKQFFSKIKDKLA